MNRPPLPPFTAETAAQKARLAEDAWNTRDPAKVALAYSLDSIWLTIDCYFKWASMNLTTSGPQTVVPRTQKPCPS